MSITVGVRTNKRALGREGEDAAVNYLFKRGYRVLYRNFRFSRYGEIDLIALKSGTICFVEVKSRSSAAYGAPAEAVGYAKRKNIIAVANHFIRTCGFQESKVRFDIVEVYYDKIMDANNCEQRAVKEIRHIENAFGEE